MVALIDDMRFNVAFFTDKKDNQPDQRSLTWSQICNLIAQPLVRKDKDGRLWSGATFVGTRSRDNAKDVWLLMLDFDKGEPTFAEAVAEWKDLGFAFAAYTTFSHSSKCEKFRILIPLARPIPGTEYERLWRWAAEACPSVDPAPKSAGSIFYCPVKSSPDAPYLWTVEPGDLLDWRYLELPDLHEKSTMPADYGYTPQPGGDNRAEKYLSAVLRGAADKVVRAQQGTGNWTLLKQARLLGGFLNMGVFTEDDITRTLTDATAGWDKKKGVAHTIRNGINYGKSAPITSIPDRPGWQPEARNGHHKNGTPAAADAPAPDPPNPPKMRKVREIREHRTDLPLIEIFNRTLDELSSQAWDALKAANSPVRILQRAGDIVRIERDETGITAKQVTADKMRYEIARAAIWQKRHDYTLPPKEIAIDMLSGAEFSLPVLNRIIPVPIFSPNGTLETTHGYSPISNNFYSPAAGLNLLPAPERPTNRQVDEALSMLMDEVLVDFPFKSHADRAAAIALFLQPFVREMISGPTPCYLLDSSMNASGKSLLGELMLFPSQMKWPSLISEIGSPEEMEKLLSAALLTRDPICFIDNVNNKIASGVFANYVTATTKKCRRLGKSEILEIPVKQTWVMTGANLELTNENARRSIQCRLEPNTATPESRTGFKHEFIKEWVERNAADLIWAAHTIVNNWIASGRPSPKGKPLGSFERWYQVIGGILECAGVGQFLGNLEDFHADSNCERTAWTEFTQEWWDNYKEQRVSVKDLMPIAEGCDGLDLHGNTDRGRQTSLGKLMNRNRTRIFGNYKIQKVGAAKGQTQWLLSVID